MPKVGYLTTEELAVKLGELKAELFNLRFQNATNQLENPVKMNYLKQNTSHLAKFNATEESNESAFSKDNKYKNSGTSSNKK